MRDESAVSRESTRERFALRAGPRSLMYFVHFVFGYIHVDFDILHLSRASRVYTSQAGGVPCAANDQRATQS